CMPAPAGVCDTFRDDVPSERSWGFGVRKTTLGRGNRVALPAITLRSLGSPKRDFLNEALVPLKADLSHRSSAETPRCIACRLKPHELGKIAHCDARALRQNIALLLILPPRRSG